ncbi:beta-phosphoglucomutase [Fusibacter bizertensis]
MIEAIIFDLDGVLVTTDHLHFVAWKRLADEIGAVGFCKEDNLRQRGVSRMDSLEVVLEKAPKQYTDAEKIAMASLKNQYYVDRLLTIGKSALLPGAIETLEWLKSLGLKIALGSASKNAQMILDKTGITTYFDALATGHDTTRSKPDPEVFLIAADKLGVTPERCVVIEDADAGVLAAVSAGMMVLGVGPAAKHELVNWSGINLADPKINWQEIISGKGSNENAV